jgi:hypothetical protein
MHLCCSAQADHVANSAWEHGVAMDVDGPSEIDLPQNAGLTRIKPMRHLQTRRWSHESIGHRVWRRHSLQV